MAQNLATVQQKLTNNFQRLGSVSNAHVGRNFESAAQDYFRRKGYSLQREHPVQIGLSNSKSRKFDLGSDDPPMLVECKSHRWTTGGNVPSAKITVWNEAMYFFHLAPDQYEKILFVLRDFSEKRNQSLAEYYVKSHKHLIPNDVKILEYDESTFRVVNVTKALARTS